MTTVQDILQLMEGFAPYALAESWDNVGLMAGDRSQPVERVLCALDATGDVIAEAIETGAQLVVAHHPLIFTSIKAVTEDDAAGRALRRAIKNDIAVICMHTNADCAEGGVNDALAAALGVTLGMSAEEIAEGIKNIKPVPHRLERSEANGVTILDDSYNCNEEGARCAVEVLKLFGENR